MVFCLHEYLVPTHMPGAQGIQKKALNSMQLEFLIIVCQHVGAGKLNLGPLEEQPVLLETALSL